MSALEIVHAVCLAIWGAQIIRQHHALTAATSPVAGLSPGLGIFEPR